MAILRRAAVAGALATAISFALGGAAQASPVRADQPAANTTSITVAKGPGHAVQTDSAARSVAITFKNLTSPGPDGWDVVPRWAWTLSHGIWTVLPPESLPKATSRFWMSESNGILTGTEGSVRYGSSFGDVTIYWDNPYIGGNSYSCTVPAFFTCAILGGGGNNASVTFLFYVNI
jgi:hypothetical protein